MTAVKGMSGDSLREMMLLTRSAVTMVLRPAGLLLERRSQPSSNASRESFSNRPSGLSVAPAAFVGGAVVAYDGPERHTGYINQYSAVL